MSHHAGPPPTAYEQVLYGFGTLVLLAILFGPHAALYIFCLVECAGRGLEYLQSR